MHTIESIANELGGRYEGKRDIEIFRINQLERAGEGEIAFLSEEKYEKHLYATRASVVMVSEGFHPRESLACALLFVDDIQKSFIRLLELFSPNDIFDDGLASLRYISPEAKVHETTVIGHFTHISDGVEIGGNCRIGSQVFLGRRVKLGKNVTLYPGVKIYANCIIGDNCILHANVVVGSDGFGYQRNKDGHYEKVPQIGGVEIEEDVEIGANTVIDRSTFGVTRIRRGVKLDNLVQVAHNVEIGENTVISAQTGISGSVQIGKNCVVGGQSAFVPRIKIAEGSQFQGKSGVGRSILEPGGKYYGYPAIGFNDYIRSYSVFKVLPELEKRVRQLEKELEQIQSTSWNTEKQSKNLSH